MQRFYFRSLQLGIAACYQNNGIGMCLHQQSDKPTSLLLRLAGYRTSVYKTEYGLLRRQHGI